MNKKSDVEIGFCKCGCGQKTNIAPYRQNGEEKTMKSNHLNNRIHDSSKTTYPRCPKCDGRLESPITYRGEIYADCLACYVSWPLAIGVAGYEIVGEAWVEPSHIKIAKECGL